MSYRVEKNRNSGLPELVIDGWENGIADSPYAGIANIRNLNTRYYGGVSYVNYKRKSGTTAGGNGVFTGSTSPSQLQLSVAGTPVMVVGDAVTVSNSGGSLPTGLSANTTYFVQAINSGSGVFQLAATYGGSAIAITGAGSGTNTVTLIQMGKPKFSCQSPSGLNYVLDSNGRVWKQSATNAGTFFLLDGNPRTGGSGCGIAYWNNYLFVMRDKYIDICGTGTGDGTIISINWNPTSSIKWPIGNVTNLILSAGGGGAISFPSAGATTALVSSYNDPEGGAQSTSWVLPTGVYQLKFNTGQVVNATITYGNSATVTFDTALQASVSTTVSAMTAVFNTQTNGGPIQHMMLSSGYNGNLLFCNNQGVGVIAPTATGYTFSPTDSTSFRFNWAYVTLVPAQDTAIWLTELQSTLLIAGTNRLYNSAYSGLNLSVVTVPDSFLPIVEPITKAINILNNIYIFAGQKGSIYISNGYSISPFKKIPDYITSLGGISGTSNSYIDPIWTIGGIMTHRQRLWFQALAQDSVTGNSVLSGIFSLGLVSASNSLSFDTPGSLVMESQSSSGVYCSSETGVLIDNTPSANGNDSYFSGWSDSSTGYGIDYNDTTLWSSNEPLIETDIIPAGTFLEPFTFSNFEFKLDQPLKSGDSISVYARQSLADPYTLLGTTATAQLSDVYTANFQKSQWIQFLIKMSCNSSAASSSFIRLREVRIR